MIIAKFKWCGGLINKTINASCEVKMVEEKDTNGKKQKYETHCLKTSNMKSPFRLSQPASRAARKAHACDQRR